MNIEEKLKCKSITQKDAKGDIILIHGFLSSKFSLKSIDEELRKEGYNIHRCNLRGHGTRITDGNPMEWDESLKEIDDLIDSINGDVILIGHSLGGAIALSEGNKNEKVKKVFAISSFNGKKSIKKREKFYRKRYKVISKLYNKNIIDKILNEKITLTMPHNSNHCSEENKNKFFLIHSKKDKVVPFSEFKKNSKELCIGKENTLIFDNGDPNLDYNWTHSPHVVTKKHKKTLEFIKEHLN